MRYGTLDAIDDLVDHMFRNELPPSCDISEVKRQLAERWLVSQGYVVTPPMFRGVPFPALPGLAYHYSTKPTPPPSHECPCGLVRSTCDYHKGAT